MPLEGPVHAAGAGPVALIASVTVRPQPSAQTPAQILSKAHVVRSILNFFEFCPDRCHSFTVVFDPFLAKILPKPQNNRD